MKIFDKLVTKTGPYTILKWLRLISMVDCQWYGTSRRTSEGRRNKPFVIDLEEANCKEIELKLWITERKTRIEYHDIIVASVAATTVFTLPISPPVSITTVLQLPLPCLTAPHIITRFADVMHSFDSRNPKERNCN